ncbi:MAG TPA: N-acetylmuramoyl-L-alanine amidase [Kiritimatiellia bacterium]|nr:N-acetylmuramoyl-L-alanine amidase [Kiritimatiellia bacterium]
MKCLASIFLFLVLACGAQAAAPSGELPAFWHEKEKFVALRDLAATYGMELSGPAAQRITIQNRSHTLIFKTDGREAQIDGTLVWLHAPVSLVRGRWAMREVDARVVVDPVMRPGRYLKSVGHRVVVIDPGHGGQDTGAKGRRGVEEKRVALDLARRLRAHLVNAGVKVYMTRESDRFIELDERCRKAGRWGADFFISIHLNSAASTSASGAETYALAAAGYESTAGGLSNLSQPGNQFEAANGVAAFNIQRALTTRLGSVDRGVKRSRFLVLKNAPCPAVLVECAFVSNPREEEKLLLEAHREAMAQSLARGTLNYLNLVKRAQVEVR